MSKNTFKKITSEIRIILFNDWDPIGINSNPNLSDEYDGYISEIMQVISKNNSIHDIVNLLKNIETNEIGCNTSDAVVYNVATKLKKLKENIYIQLLGEGTIVYRPVPAIKLKNNLYRIGGQEIYDPEDEEWEFLPEDIVQVEERELNGECVLVAIKKKNEDTGKL